jgi:hypothetical protein
MRPPGGIAALGGSVSGCCLVRVDDNVCTTYLSKEEMNFVVQSTFVTAK